MSIVRYIMFCEEITNLTPAEAEWVRVKQAERENYWATGSTQDDTEDWANMEGVDFYLRMEGNESALRIESNEYASVDAAVAFIKGFLAEFRRQEVVLFEWAETCNRMLPAHFGGGACRITVTNVEWLWTRSRLYE